MDDSSRRLVLGQLGGTLALGVAGCIGTDGTGESTPTGSPSDGRTPSDAPGATPTGTATDSATRWRVDLDTREPPTAPVARRLAYVGAGETVRAFEPATGEEAWSATLDAPAASLAVAAGTVYVHYRERGMGGHPRALAAFDAASGTRRWTREFDGGTSRLTAGARRVYVSTADDVVGDTETLIALAAADGSERWTTTLPEPENLVVDGADLFVGSSAGVHRLDARDGTERWHAEFDYQFATLVSGPETVAAIEGGDPGDSAVRVFERNGDPRWTFDEWFVIGLTLRAGRLVVGGEHLAAFDPADPDPQWTVDRAGYAYHAPVTDGAILVGTDGIRAYDLDDGTERWAFATDGASPLPEAVHDGTVYGRTTAADDNRHVYGVDADAGTEQWQLTAEGGFSRIAAGDTGIYVTGESGTLYALA